MRLGQCWSLLGRPHSYLDTSSQTRGLWVPGRRTQSSGCAELHPVPPGPRGVLAVMSSCLPWSRAGYRLRFAQGLSHLRVAVTGTRGQGCDPPEYCSWSAHVGKDKFTSHLITDKCRLPWGLSGSRQVSLGHRRFLSLAHRLGEPAAGWGGTSGTSLLSTLSGSPKSKDSETCGFHFWEARGLTL